ncbi:hypothetical protein [Burkholderia arboris]
MTQLGRVVPCTGIAQIPQLNKMPGMQAAVIGAPHLEPNKTDFT